MWTSASRSMLQSDLAVISVCVSRSQSPFINSLYHINLHKGVAMFYTHLQCKCTKPLFWSQLSLFVLDSSWYFSGPIRPIRSMALSGMRGISALSDVSQMTWQWMTRWHSQTVFYWQILPFACVVILQFIVKGRLRMPIWSETIYDQLVIPGFFLSLLFKCNNPRLWIAAFTKSNRKKWLDCCVIFVLKRKCISLSYFTVTEAIVRKGAFIQRTETLDETGWIFAFEKPMEGW